MNDRMVWIDCEMTGLDLTRDALVEIAVLVTDSELNVLGDGVDLIIQPQRGVDIHARHRPRHAHGVRPAPSYRGREGDPLAEAEEQVLACVRSQVLEPRKAPLAGNTVYTDRAFLARDMPTLESHLHYRIIDVSSIKELARRWYPGLLRQPAEVRRSPSARRHHRQHRRVALLPFGCLRATSRSGYRDGTGDRGALRRTAGRPVPTRPPGTVAETVVEAVRETGTR